jgi:hypothetical protein
MTYIKTVMNIIILKAYQKSYSLISVNNNKNIASAKTYKMGLTSKPLNVGILRDFRKIYNFRKGNVSVG